MTKILSIAVLLVALAASGMARAADKVCASHLGEILFKIPAPSADADIPIWLRELNGSYSFGALGGVACATTSITVHDNGTVSVYFVGGPAPLNDANGLWIVSDTAHIVGRTLHVPYGNRSEKTLTIEPIRPGVIRVTGNYGRTGLLARSQELATWNHPTFACEGAWPKVEQVHTSIASSRLAEGARYAGSWLGHLRHGKTHATCVNLAIISIDASGAVVAKYSWPHGWVPDNTSAFRAGTSTITGKIRDGRAVLRLRSGKKLTLLPTRDSAGVTLSMRLEGKTGYNHGTLRRLPEDWTPPKVTSFTVPKPVPVKPTGEETVASAKDDWSYLDRNDP